MNSEAVVTGPSQGIDRCTAIRLARGFSTVVLAARNANALKEVASGGASGLRSRFEQDRVCRSPCQNSHERFGRIDALLNIAGAVPQVDLFEMTDEQWRASRCGAARSTTVVDTRLGGAPSPPHCVPHLHDWSDCGSITYQSEPLERPAPGNVLVCCS